MHITQWQQLVKLLKSDLSMHLRSFRIAVQGSSEAKLASCVRHEHRFNADLLIFVW